MKIESVINGYNFRRAAKLVIDTPPTQWLDVSMLQEGDIIFCKTDYIFHLFHALLRLNNGYKFKLITHCSDYAITAQIFNTRPPCISKWFAQNVAFKHDDLIPIPIGLENHDGPSKGGYIDPAVLAEPYQESKDRAHAVYCNFSLHTHPNRVNVRSILSRNNNCIFDADRTFRDYCEALKRYKFVASPRGNGIDCHRTWEALYMGALPIVESNFIYDSWNFLPILQIDKWENLNGLLNNCDCNLPAALHYYLDIEFWIDRIKNHAC
jgi:hypothetical protein